MNKQESVAVGQAIVELFSLKQNKDTSRYNTTWGSKTVEGIGRCVERIVREAAHTIDTTEQPKQVYVIEPEDAVVHI
jgi:hypothetical protein